MKSLFKMMNSLFKLNFVIITALFCLSSCKNPALNNTPFTMGKLYNFEKILVKGGDFWITTYQKIENKYEPYVFYIEGDQSSFSGKYKVSNNPTPKRQMFISLAAMDKRANVVYIAMPCQYTPMELNPQCDFSYWTDKRLSENSVAAINDVIRKINPRDQKFSLVGYSAGGAITVLIAARNPMVKDIITIAGYLDSRAFTDYHNVPPMIGSLNPINYAKLINNIPQRHISGGKDIITPAFIADKYVEESSSFCVKQEIFPDLNHKNGWDKIWEYIYTRPVTCYE
jgi:dienelactone hydrolase